jgi:hypothetical protein
MKNSVTIIFSKNRAMQLTLCLETLFNHCNDILDLSDIYVLYKVDPSHRESYEIVKKEFSMVNFVEETIFKEDLLKIVLPNESNISWGNEPPYMVVFLTDDTLCTGSFSIKKVISTLNENKDCIGFSLRLGKNTHRCFPYNCEQKVPEMEYVKDNIYKYKWENAEYDFNYPLELSSSVYRLGDINQLLELPYYSNPNYLESILNQCIAFEGTNLLCFKTSVAFSNPINRVNTTHPNRSGQINENELMELFMEGYRIDDTLFNGFVSNGAHQLIDINLKG